jgi:2-oxoglutarate dehydrogenase E2 component (dihydrolipoamide succinyltransferase)
MMDLLVPSMGESVTEGRITRWIKPTGSFVRRDEPVCEVETDKASVEVPAPSDGVLTHRAQPGDTVAVGSTIGVIDPSNIAGSSPPPTPPKTAQQAPAPGHVPAGAVLSPAAQRLATEANVPAESVVATGKGGRIIKEDIAAAIAKREQPPAPTTVAARAAEAAVPAVQTVNRVTRVRMTGIRQRIAERLVESQQTTATLSTFNEVDMSGVMALRERYKERFKEKHTVGLGFMSFFVKAAIEGLRAFPVVNARIDGHDIVHQHFYDIGVAVSTERGLMVPIVRDADTLSFAAIEKRIIELAVKARDGKISVDDLKGGTFTITNGGIFGSMLSTPILNPPQSAILGMHSIQKRAVVVNDQIVIRPMMYVALSYDHRIIDGRDAVQFLVRLKECIENPERLLLEI